MSDGRLSATAKFVCIGTGLLVLLSGCVYDYSQHSDRVAYSAGEAVQANLERQTTNPAKRSMLNTDGLGQDGVVIVLPPDEAEPAE